MREQTPNFEVSMHSATLCAIRHPDMEVSMMLSTKVPSIRLCHIFTITGSSCVSDHNPRQTRIHTRRHAHILHGYGQVHINVSCCETNIHRLEHNGTHTCKTVTEQKQSVSNTRVCRRTHTHVSASARTHARMHALGHCQDTVEHTPACAALAHTYEGLLWHRNRASGNRM